MMQGLRKVEVSVRKSKGPFNGYFHQWYTSVQPGGETELYAIIEREDNGIVGLYPKIDTEIKFLPDAREKWMKDLGESDVKLF